MRLIKYLLYTCSISILLLGCQSEPEIPTIIKMDYYLRIDQNVPIARTDVRFIKENDTSKVELLDVQFEGISMKGIDVGNNMMQYSYNDKMQRKDNYNLRFQTKDKEQYSYDFTIIPIKDFTIKEGKVSKSQGFTITWDGADLQNNETMVILLTDATGGSIAMNWIAAASATEGIYVRPEQLGGYTAGMGNIYLTRKTTVTIPQANNIEGKGNLEYYTTAKPIEIVE